MSDVEPLVVRVDLAVPPDVAWDAFAGDFADWWPVGTHSLSRCGATRCRLDARVGGAVEEFAPDGTRHPWGEVLLLEPGRRLRFSWHPGREAGTAQWVEVEFAPAAAGCRVTLTHGGWEALGEIGPLLRQEYLPGWHHVLGAVFARFVAGR